MTTTTTPAAAAEAAAAAAAAASGAGRAPPGAAAAAAAAVVVVVVAAAAVVDGGGGGRSARSCPPNYVDERIENKKKKNVSIELVWLIRKIGPALQTTPPSNKEPDLFMGNRETKSSNRFGPESLNGSIGGWINWRLGCYEWNYENDEIMRIGMLTCGWRPSSRWDWTSGCWPAIGSSGTWR